MSRPSGTYVPDPGEARGTFVPIAERGTFVTVAEPRGEFTPVPPPAPETGGAFDFTDADNAGLYLVFWG